MNPSVSFRESSNHNLDRVIYFLRGIEQQRAVNCIHHKEEYEDADARGHLHYEHGDRTKDRDELNLIYSIPSDIDLLFFTAES